MLESEAGEGREGACMGRSALPKKLVKSVSITGRFFSVRVVDTYLIQGSLLPKMICHSQVIPYVSIEY